MTVLLSNCKLKDHFYGLYKNQFLIVPKFQPDVADECITQISWIKNVRRLLLQVMLDLKQKIYKL